MKKRIYWLLVAFFVAVFLVSGYFLLDYYLDSRKHQTQFRELAHIVEAEQEAILADPMQESAFVTITDPDTGTPLRVLREYAEIYRRNSHTIGWLKIEGTKINYPVMQTPDSPDYYLHRDFDKNRSNHGCLYAEEDCTVLSDNITIYGHNMKDGSMFASLLNYKSKSYLDAHPYIQFDTIYDHGTYAVAAVFLTTATSGEGFSYHRFIDAETPEEFDNYISACKALSYYDTGITPGYSDKLITLSTCDYSVTDGRLVVVAVKLPEA